MPGMKISLDAAMRARDVSQPEAADRAKAEALADAGWSSGSDGARSSDRRRPARPPVTGLHGADCVRRWRRQLGGWRRAATTGSGAQAA